jgi:hypothetical protein
MRCFEPGLFPFPKGSELFHLVNNVPKEVRYLALIFAVNNLSTTHHIPPAKFALYHLPAQGERLHAIIPSAGTDPSRQ